jgi:hypothetical protein
VGIIGLGREFGGQTSSSNQAYSCEETTAGDLVMRGHAGLLSVAWTDAPTSNIFFILGSKYHNVIYSTYHNMM